MQRTWAESRVQETGKLGSQYRKEAHEQLRQKKQGGLGGSWVVISRVIGILKKAISIVAILKTLLITTHEPPTGNSTP